MCGICGFFSKNLITTKQLSVMNDTMIRRGPNDSGVEIYEASNGYNVGLAQRRLSIQDLSPNGHQPMNSPDNRISVVFNGEIYNFPELKKELSDYPYKGGSDTEVILSGYLKYGIDFVKRIHGMFAIAIYDRETEKLYLIRDRVGVKPLYYWIKDENIVFGSVLAPIMQCPFFHPQIRKEIISRYLFQQYINAPDTIYKDVYKLEPGMVLEFDKGQIKKWKYWDVKEAYKEGKSHQVRNYNEAKQTLKRLLKEAVSKRMVADVPIGTFLSGGYDSSLVTAIAQELSDEPVKTFSIGFEDKRYDESEYARAISDYLGTDHTDIKIDEDEMLRQVVSIPQYFDEPFADSSQIPNMLVSRLARDKVTVVLSGDAGDEFFCGYNIYANLAKAQKLDLLGAAAWRVGDFKLKNNQKLLDKYPFKVRAIAQNRDIETKCQLASEAYIRVSNAFISGKQEDDIQMFAGEYRELSETSFLQEKGIMIPCRYPIESTYNEDNWVIRRMLLDMDTYLPGDILCKVDRATMKYSLEARCPILDTSVMEYSYRIPQKFKYYKGDKKHILKDIAYDYIPRQLLERPKKGFSVPLDTWLRGPLKTQLLDYSGTDFLKKQGLFNPEFVTTFIDKYLETGDKGPSSGANFSQIAWSFFVFQKWYDTYH
ncbi:asparagine synthase (glutamine-hydrolyzing) [Butyrivibrio sp. NC3005]|uniref:asparagine synthase (glutamine-hydrolyzing) n=1 Tax=Butyrivibrio sp. NC3005 TaxID=1280685 RepID=UPI0004129AF7|nr:asparagine synthase (glutamine-hydrolyzing) [Butyrivibrio sp. NC3005]